MQRIFDGEFTHGELHFYANTLDGEGAETPLHAHKFPHVAEFWPGEPAWLRVIKAIFRFFGVYHWLGFAEYEVFAINSAGEEVLLPMDAWGFVYIEAGIDHKVRLKKGDLGKFACLFSRVGEDGSIRPDPKCSHGS